MYITCLSAAYRTDNETKVLSDSINGSNIKHDRDSDQDKTLTQDE